MTQTAAENDRKPESPQQLAERVGVSVGAIRGLIRDQKIDHFFTTPGKRRPKIPVGAWERYVESNTVRACLDGDNCNEILRTDAKTLPPCRVGKKSIQTRGQSQDFTGEAQ